MNGINEQVVDAFIHALENGSVSGVIACYAPDARIWHNFDQIAMTSAESVASLETLFNNFVSRKYVEVRRHAARHALVQQHVLRLKTEEGRTIDWPGCIVFGFEDNLISRVDEYVDLASLAK